VSGILTSGKWSYYMTAIESLYAYLLEGKGVTSANIRKKFNVRSARDLIYRLRNDGVPVYTNRVVQKNGNVRFEYRIGSPSTEYTKAMKSGHRTRARRSLFKAATVN
jgi:hypothetical protein